MSVSKFQPVCPAVALGEDLVIDLTGPQDPSGWALEATASHSPTGPAETFPGLTVTAVGGANHVIRVTLPRADTLTVQVDPETGTGTLYAEVWRTDPGETRPLRRLAIPFYDPAYEG